MGGLCSKSTGVSNPAAAAANSSPAGRKLEGKVEIIIKKKNAQPSPYDLSSFVMLGGKVSEDLEEEDKRVQVSTFNLDQGFQPPAPSKPLGDMTESELQEHEAKVLRARKKYDMAMMMERNLQKKDQEGFRTPDKSAGGEAGGSFNKKQQQETVEERVKRQAMMGAGGTGTGGSIANVGLEVASSERIKLLEEKRKEFERKESERKKNDETQKRLEEQEREKQKPKGLKDFLSKNELPSAATSSGHKPAEGETSKDRLQAFLKSSTTNTDSAVVVEEEKPVAQPSGGSKLQAFLGSTSTTTTTTTTTNGGGNALRAFLSQDKVEEPVEVVVPVVVEVAAVVVEEEKPVPVVVVEEEKPVPVVVVEEEKPAPVVVVEEEKPVPVVVVEEEKPAPVVEEAVAAPVVEDAAPIVEEAVPVVEEPVVIKEEPVVVKEEPVVVKEPVAVKEEPAAAEVAAVMEEGQVIDFAAPRRPSSSIATVAPIASPEAAISNQAVLE